MKVELLPLRGLAAPDLARWQDLARGALEPDPFCEPALALPAAALLPGGAEARLLTVADRGRMLFALPVRRQGHYRRLPVPSLVSWQHDYCFAGTPLLAPDAPVATWAALLSGLRERAPWLVLERLPADGPVAEALDQALQDRPGTATRLDGWERPVLRRRDEPTYLDGRLSARHQKTLRRQRRRLGEALGGEVRCVDRAGDPAAVEQMLALEATGWKGAAGTAMACTPAHAELFRSVCRAFAEAGRLELWSLEAGGRTAAWQCNLRAADTVFHYKIAYDEELARWSPGLQLEVDMVEAFAADGSLAQIDSCVDPGNRVSSQLYADRRLLETRVLPVGGAVARLAAQGAPAVVTAYRRLKAVRHPVAAP